jgi:hypothetical protein
MWGGLWCYACKNSTTAGHWINILDQHWTLANTRLAYVREFEPESMAGCQQQSRCVWQDSITVGGVCVNAMGGFSVT